jgi:transcription initiation factor TFIIH subunit 2
MADSDGEYVADDLSDDDLGSVQVDGGHGTRSSGPVKGGAGSTTRGGDKETGGNRRRAAWEDIQRSWDTVVEGADGSINSTVEGLREASKRQRLVHLNLRYDHY